MTETRYYEPTRLSTQSKPLFHSFTKNLFLVKPLDATAWLRSLLSKVSPIEATMLKRENDIAMQSFCYRVLERFHSRGRHLCKFYWNKTKRLHKKGSQLASPLAEDYFGTPTWPRVAAISLFWNTNMAAVTFCKNTLYAPSRTKSVDSFQILKNHSF